MPFTDSKYAGGRRCYLVIAFHGYSGTDDTKIPILVSKVRDGTLAQKNDGHRDQYSEGEGPDELVRGCTALLNHIGSVLPHKRLQDYVIAVPLLQGGRQFAAHRTGSVAVGVIAFEQDLSACLRGGTTEPSKAATIGWRNIAIALIMTLR